MVGGLVIVVSYAGFASPLVVLVAFIASLCCASSIAEFARRLPSAGSLYTYNSRGLGRTGGFLTGWMMVFAYALYVPAGIALTSRARTGEAGKIESSLCLGAGLVRRGWSGGDSGALGEVVEGGLVGAACGA